MAESTLGILIGKGDDHPIHLNPRFANRHGLIAGATGTGKTISLQGLAEGFARLGVPVFMADVKGDLTGIAMPGSPNPKVEERVNKIGIPDFRFEGYPTILWDLLGERGHPIRATVSDMGPLLLARLLDLNDTQEGVLNIAFKVADEQGLLLLDLKDLRAMLQFLGENSKEIGNLYGNVSPATIGAIQRQLLVLEQQGADKFFGEPALNLWDFMRTGANGYGHINILAAEKLIHTPRLYATFLLWLLSELFENLPEVGDLDKPRLVFFFDEAHLLFDDAPKALIDKVEQVVRLIRSKGVGIYFITQSPLDIPETVLGQLGNRIQHALRAFTPRDQKAVRTAAETFRQNPKLNTAETIMQMGVGEALVSVLEEKGIPSLVQRTLIRPPQSRIGPLTDAERSDILRRSPFAGRYDVSIDRESAYELLQKRAATAAEAAAAQAAATGQAKSSTRRTSDDRAPESLLETLGTTLVKQAMKAATSSAGKKLGTQLVRGLLGSLFKGR